MKVIEQTPTLLILQERLLGIQWLGGGTALLGFIIFFIFEFPYDLFGCFCLSIAALMSTLSPVEICTFDKPEDFVLIEKKRLFSCQTRRYAMTQIEAVVVAKKSWLGIEFHQIKLSFFSGHQTTLTQFPTTDQLLQYDLADQIQGFLELQDASSSYSLNH